MSDGHAVASFGNDHRPPRCRSQLFIFGQRNSIDDQNFDLVGILNANQKGVSGGARPQVGTTRKNEFFLGFRPLKSQGHQVVECLLIYHSQGWGISKTEQYHSKRQAGAAFEWRRIRSQTRSAWL